MHKARSSHSKVMKLLVFLAQIAAFQTVKAQMSAIYKTEECASCIAAGHVACRSATDDTLGYCCNPNGIDIEQCSSHVDQNFGFCTSDVNDPSSNPYACPYQEEACFWQPCKGIVGDVETDCTFDNSAMLEACIEASRTEDFGHPCAKGGDTVYSEGGGLDLTTIDFSIYSLSELLDLKRRYDAGEFDNYGAEERTHPFLERCQALCGAADTPEIRMDPALNDFTAVSGSGRRFKGGTDCYFAVRGLNEYT